jgi:hypothetical protein
MRYFSLLERDFRFRTHFARAGSNYSSATAFFDMAFFDKSFFDNGFRCLHLSTFDSPFRFPVEAAPRQTAHLPNSAIAIPAV